MTLPSIEFLLTAGRAALPLLACVLAAVAFVGWRRATHVQTETVLANVNAVLEQLAEIEARVDATKLLVSELGERIDHPMQRPTAAAPAAPAYQIAIRLAKTGAAREELMTGCGLSLDEAELVRRLHGPATAGARHARVNAVT
jgi:alkylation response protein AidB-like acyl-CoA dehydrogenase